ncbi:MAG: dipeptide epimerase [Microbacterium sp.]|uniref:mandelate racemase/muconate lactonizing enzyme family protein n=1 Tax=Microbacterium sp. TaxID=51671 RepID=UPI001E198F8E|nr:dipeptide epimerase [Microbacterium sp.]MBW8761528.1 dipeptide epimerase [Microbacterium sp.]
MSVVDRLRVLRVSSPLVRPFVTNVRRVDALDVVLIEATDSDGRRGWGEAAISWRVTGESPESVAAVVAGPFADVVLGAGVEDADRRLAGAAWGNAAARSAMECALVDLAAQARGIPLSVALAEDAYRAPSSAPPIRIRTDMTLSAGLPDDLAVQAAAHVAAGFRCLKTKVSADTDALAGLRAVRAAVGEGIALRVDANQAWDAATAIAVIRSCEDAGLGLDLVEQPVPAGDLDGLARVVAAVETPIMADESVRTAADVRAIAERGAAHIVNIKFAKTGGPAEARRAALTAREHGLDVVFGCMMESAVGVTAAVHLAAALSPEGIHDLDAALWLRRSPVVGGIRSAADQLVLGDVVGIGVAGLDSDVDADVLVDIRAGVRV